MQTNDEKIIENVLIYCRVSTEEQAKNNNSIMSQENLCRDFADSKKYRVVAVYKDEGRSATNLNRPALQDMLDRCMDDKSIDGVVITETDRLARSTEGHFAIRTVLRKSGVKLIAVTQPMLDDSPEGQVVDTILAGVNQLFSQLNGRKTKRGMQTKFEMGGFPGWAPVGYLNKRVDENGIIEDVGSRYVDKEEYLLKKSKTKGIVVKDSTKFDLVKEALKMYLTGNYSALEIADVMNEKGLTSRNSKRISNSCMIRILRDPFYAGIIRFKGQEKMGSHEKMITKEEHLQILNIMDAHNLHRSRRRINNFLLRGFIFCDICKTGRYTAEKHRIGKTHNYYHCSHKVVRHSNKGQNVQVEDLEEQVEEQFKTIKFSNTFIEAVNGKLRRFYEDQKKEKKHEVRILFNKKLKIDKDREVAERKLISGVLEDDDYARIKIRLKEEEGILNKQIYELEKKNEIDFETIRKVLLLARDIYQAYKKAPYELKRLYLSLFFDGFWVKDKKIVRTEPTKLIKTFKNEGKIIIRADWCPRWESNPHEETSQHFKCCAYTVPPLGLVFVKYEATAGIAPAYTSFAEKCFTT